MENRKIFLPGNLLPPHGFIPVPAYFSDAKWRLGSNGIWAGSQFLGIILIIAITLMSNDRLLESGVLLNSLMIRFLLAVIPAMGFLIVFANGGLDLSMGSVGALAASVAALTMTSGMPPVVAVIMALGLSMLFGLINGSLVGIARVPGLLVTLVAGILIHGLMNSIMGGETISVDDSLSGMPLFGLFMLILLAGGAFIWIQFPAYGVRSSSGTSRIREALQAGLPYVLSALFAGIYGLVFAHRINAATPLMGTNLVFENLAIMIFAGVCWYSRFGNVFGVILGALTLALLNFMMSIMGVDIFIQSVILGIICLSGLGWMYLYHWIVGLIYCRVAQPDTASGQNAADTLA